MKSLKFLFGLMGLIALALLANAETAITTGLAIGPVAYMENYAQNNFSSFEGDNMYTGMGDHFLDFGGPSESFATEKNAGRIFVFTIANTYTTTKNVTIIPGYTWKPGDTDATKLWLADGIFAGSDSTILTGEGSPSTIKEFLSFISKNPTTVAGIRISSNNNVAQIEQQITVTPLSPWKTLESQNFNAGAYVSERDNRTTMVTVPTPGLIIGPETELMIPIMGSSIATITFFCGGVLSTSSALKAKRNEAIKTIANVGLANLQAQSVALPLAKPLVIPRQIAPQLLNTDFISRG